MIEVIIGAGLDKKFRVESIFQNRDNPQPIWKIFIEGTDQRNVPMERSWDYQMALPHFGIVTDSDSAEVQYTFGSHDLWKSFKEVI